MLSKDFRKADPVW